MKWYFLSCFIAGVMVCTLITSFMVFAIVAHHDKWPRIVMGVLPNLAIFV